MISDELVERIASRISEAGLVNEALKDDLIDHFCCLVEMKMDKGQTFDEAYAQAFEQTSPNGLKEIENETIFLLNYNKIIMLKRITYIVGFIFTCAWSVGILFKFLHLPGAMFLLFSGGTGMAFVFLPLLLVNRFKDRAPSVMSEKLKWILGSLSFMLFTVSGWMKIMHLQGAAVILAVSLLMFSFGFLPFLFFRMYKTSLEKV